MRAGDLSDGGWRRTPAQHWTNPGPMPVPTTGAICMRRFCSVQYGPSLTIDPASELFAGENSVTANAQRSRDYRAPFVVLALV